MDEKDIMLDDVLNTPGLFDEPIPEEVEQIPQGQEIDTGLQETEAAQGGEAVEDATAQAEQIPQAGVQQQPDPQYLLMQMIAGQQKQISDLQQALQQQSQTQEQAIVQQMQSQPATPPTIDFNELLYADDDIRAQKQQDWINGMTDFVKQSALKDMEPVLNDYKATKETQEFESAAKQLKGLPDIGDKLGTAIDGAGDVVNQIPALKQLSPSDALILGALIVKGKEALNAPVEQQKTPEALAQEVIANPQVMKIIAAHNAEQLKQNAGTPAMAAGKGGVSPAPINVQKKPETLEEGLAFFDELMNP